ncbi:MAG: DUF4142 domain-containing protein [Fimbriimonadaceae bacterium]|nr:DUF4142 domain-containing protein [Chitinophagales bacterium]
MGSFKNLFMAVSAVALFVSCKDTKNNEDQAEVAEDINEDKFGKKTEKDADFLVDATTISLEEISLGELALTKATMEDTKHLADMMILDHTKASKEVAAMAQKKGIVVPTQLTDESMKDREGLMKKEGIEFDKEYAKMMVKGHKDAIDKFEKAAKDSDDPDITSWANATLVTLKSHLTHAEQCEEKLKDAK